jgi:hypothetical protein
MSPMTRLFWVRTGYCSHLTMWMDFGDGEPFAMPQQWIASPPRLPHGVFDPSILRKVFA